MVNKQPIQTAPAKKNEKEPISILILLFVHWTIGGGIAFIGERMKYKTEFYTGLLFIVVAVGLMIGTFAYPCDSQCAPTLSTAPHPPLGALCSTCDLHAVFAGLLGLLSLGSWLYIAVRLFLIHQKGENTFKFI